MPAVDPYVSPVFSGKVFCSSCTVFEGGSHFLVSKGEVRREEMRGWREGSEKEEGREEIKKDNIFLTSLLQKANNLASMLDGLEVYLSVSFL